MMASFRGISNTFLRFSSLNPYFSPHNSSSAEESLLRSSLKDKEEIISFPVFSIVFEFKSTLACEPSSLYCRLEFQFQTEWIEKCSLKESFPTLCTLVLVKNARVAYRKAVEGDKGHWNSCFHRAIQDWELEMLGISFSTTEKTLAEAFSQFGEVVEAKIIMDKRKLRPKGFAYVTFTREDEAEKALTENEWEGKAASEWWWMDERFWWTMQCDEGMPIAGGPPEPASNN
ncbi:Small RNA-binding protein 11, chloroplastic [Vitis vinifera]|uniref:Small RNA-binding protein 11, chloroplastic n=1 Tax=Vitis vinifera TaxID=29760 RepID=A0A438HQG1_VITVI|nr:Small RNA-binding protein 11, chloroplastic [Vitis vinifera]